MRGALEQEAVNQSSGVQDHRLELALKRARAGDPPAFAELVRDHQGMVFSIAYHYLQDRSLAEDLAQEVFLELYQNLGRIQSAAHLTFWLRRVTANRCIDYGRRKLRRRELALEDTPEPAASDSPVDPLLSQRLQQGLAALPDRQRMVVILRFQEGLGPAEIAEALEMPVNTVKSTLHRSLEELRKGLTRKLKEVRYAFF
ncbi:MAG TPA: sigma-70 family RNA polymerase sigma factor [Candidatus Angelobacter sp.]|nr:sigma-70 family RNA polymerase sigma factor [Candidatus Angelobacter sp.]